MHPVLISLLFFLEQCEGVLSTTTFGESLPHFYLFQ